MTSGWICGLSCVAIMLQLAASGAMAGDTSAIKTDIDWPAFLARHNLHWTQMPGRWQDAPFLGNGMMGTMLLQSGEQTVRWQVGRGDVQDHRPLSNLDQKIDTMYARNRLPIGYFELNTVGKITGGTIELDLWNAEARGELQTDKGTIAWRSIVHADRMVILTELNPSAGEAGCRWVWHADRAISPRLVAHHKTEKDLGPGYPPNPDPVQSAQGEINLCTQKLVAGGQTVTAWTERERAGKRLLVVSVAHTFPDEGAARQAVEAVESATRIPTDPLIESHRAWWHRYYPESFVSIPDADWEGFYWVQMYKLASATRADGMLIDNQGPWLEPTPWPGVWWDLNVQLTYWPTYDANRLELGSSLNRHIYQHVQELIDNVPEACRADSAAVGGATGQNLRGNVAMPDGHNAPMPGLLLWGLHNCWLHYRHTMDDAELRDHLLPILKRAVNFYYHFMTRDDHGVLHLPQTFSPEYKAGKGPDTNFELALLRWGCTALIDGYTRLGIGDPLLPQWRDTLEHLAPYPVDENGYMVAAGVPFKVRHRHYSHLLMLYPLYLVNADQDGAEALAMKSLKHWQHFSPANGYSFTGASSISSAFGHGNEALAYLQKLRRVMSHTTMYSEAGGAPVIESPLSGAQSIHDMILQSWGDTIRVFPAAPDAWADITFHDLRAQGAFLISAVRAKGVTPWVRIQSLAGQPCRIKPNMPGVVHVTGSRSFELKDLGGGVYSLDLKKGEQAILFSGDHAPDTTIRPVHK